MDMICEYCGARSSDHEICQDLCNQVSFYTLNHAEPEYFIHQLVVDAYAAQHAKENSKPIKIAFALIGLYLFTERGYTGREVQLAHMQLGKVKREYPRFVIPENRGNITVADVLNVKAGPNRDEMIKKWAMATWQAFIESRQQVLNILAKADFKNIK